MRNPLKLIDYVLTLMLVGVVRIIVGKDPALRLWDNLRP